MKVVKPTLWVNETVARSNIRKMAEKAAGSNAEFKPHFKTHQSKEVGEWFRDEGVKAITVSSVSMAAYFAEAGWDDITIAFPVNVLELTEIDELANKVKLSLLVVDERTVQQLNRMGNSVSVLIEIDAGYHRSGVAVDAYDSIQGIINSIQNTRHRFSGFYCHSGNSYYSKLKEEVIQLFESVQPKLIALKRNFAAYEPLLSIGDTPTCSIIDSFEEIDCIHPGNFAYYDIMQTEIGSCQPEDVAVAVECPVVMTDKKRAEIIIYGGGVHLSKESIEVNGRKMFGLVALSANDNTWDYLPDTYVKSLSQEHGIITSTPDTVSSIEPGDTLFIVPVHSCMTVDCMQVGYSLDGKMLSQIHKYLG